MWKEFEIETVNKKNQELGIGNSFPSKCFVNLEEVNAFFENEENDSEHKLTTLLFKSGDSFSIYTPYSEMLALFRLHMKGHEIVTP